jgi:hypothetical protein
MKLRDAIEFRIQGFTFLGEGVHSRQGGDKWLADVRIEKQLNDEQLNRILEPL